MPPLVPINPPMLVLQAAEAAVRQFFDAHQELLAKLDGEAAGNPDVLAALLSNAEAIITSRGGTVPSHIQVKYRKSSPGCFDICAWGACWEICF